MKPPQPPWEPPRPPTEPPQPPQQPQPASDLGDSLIYLALILEVSRMLCDMRQMWR